MALGISSNSGPNSHLRFVGGASRVTEFPHLAGPSVADRVRVLLGKIDARLATSSDPSVRPGQTLPASNPLSAERYKFDAFRSLIVQMWRGVLEPWITAHESVLGLVAGGSVQNGKIDPFHLVAADDVKNALRGKPVSQRLHTLQLLVTNTLKCAQLNLGAVYQVGMPEPTRLKAAEAEVRRKVNSYLRMPGEPMSATIDFGATADFGRSDTAKLDTLFRESFRGRALASSHPGMAIGWREGLFVGVNTAATVMWQLPLVARYLAVDGLGITLTDHETLEARRSVRATAAPLSLTNQAILELCLPPDEARTFEGVTAKFAPQMFSLGKRDQALAIEPSDAFYDLAENTDPASPRFGCAAIPILSKFYDWNDKIAEQFLGA